MVLRASRRHPRRRADAVVAAAAAGRARVEEDQEAVRPLRARPIMSALGRLRAITRSVGKVEVMEKQSGFGVHAVEGKKKRDDDALGASLNKVQNKDETHSDHHMSFEKGDVHATDYKNEGNEEHETAEAREQRKKLQDDKEVKRWLRVYWNTFQKEHRTLSNLLRKEPALGMQLCMCKALFAAEDWDLQTVLKQVQREWTKEVGWEKTMNQKQFEDSLFEVVDVWTMEIDPVEYRQFLRSLFTRITHENEDIGRREYDQLGLYAPEDGELYKAWGSIKVALAVQQSVKSQQMLASVRQKMVGASYVTGKNGKSKSSMPFLLKKLDKDRDGVVSPDDMKTGVRKVLKISKNELSDKDIDVLMVRLDINKDHIIGVKELAAFCNDGQSRGSSKQIELNEFAAETPERAACDWIAELTGLAPLSMQPASVASWLANGSVLCKLINLIKPGAVSAALIDAVDACADASSAAADEESKVADEGALEESDALGEDEQKAGALALKVSAKTKKKPEKVKKGESSGRGKVAAGSARRLTQKEDPRTEAAKAFLAACADLGVSDVLRFKVVELVEGRSIEKVLRCVNALRGLVLNNRNLARRVRDSTMGAQGNESKPTVQEEAAALGAADASASLGPAPAGGAPADGAPAGGAPAGGIASFRRATRKVMAVSAVGAHTVGWHKVHHERAVAAAQLSLTGIGDATPWWKRGEIGERVEVLMLSQVRARMLEAALDAEQKGTTLFAIFDADNSGHIDRDELKRGLRGPLKLSEFAVSDDEIDVLWERLDPDRSGFVEVRGWTPPLSESFALILESICTDARARHVARCLARRARGMEEDQARSALPAFERGVSSRAFHR